MTVACVMGKTVPPSTHNTKGKQNGVRALTSGPAVLTEQRTRQPHRFRRPLTDSTISALPLLRVAPAPRPPPPGSPVIFFLRVLSLVGVHSPKDVAIGSLQLQRGWRGLRRRGASCLIPLTPCKSFTPSPRIHTTGGLKGAYPTRQHRVGAGCPGWKRRFD